MRCPNDPLAVITIVRGPGERGQDRLLRLLDLQQQRRPVIGDEQADRAEGADAADPDDFEGHVAQAVALQQDAPVLLQRLSVACKGLARIELTAAQMAHQRRFVFDAPMAARRLE